MVQLATEDTEGTELTGLRGYNSSFPRKRESSEQTFLIRSFFVYWILVPAFAGINFRRDDERSGCSLCDLCVLCGKTKL